MQSLLLVFALDKNQTCQLKTIAVLRLLTLTHHKREMGSESFLVKLFKAAGSSNKSKALENLRASHTHRKVIPVLDKKIELVHKPIPEESKSQGGEQPPVEVVRAVQHTTFFDIFNKFTAEQQQKYVENFFGKMDRNVGRIESSWVLDLDPRQHMHKHSESFLMHYIRQHAEFNEKGEVVRYTISPKAAEVLNAHWVGLREWGIENNKVASAATAANKGGFRYEDPREKDKIKREKDLQNKQKQATKAVIEEKQSKPLLEEEFAGSKWSKIDQGVWGCENEKGRTVVYGPDSKKMKRLARQKKWGEIPTDNE